MRLSVPTTEYQTPGESTNPSPQFSPLSSLTAVFSVDPGVLEGTPTGLAFAHSSGAQVIRMVPVPVRSPVAPTRTL